MNPPRNQPVPYKVSYSERVRAELKRLLSRAVSSGLGQPVLQAVKAIDTRLRVYPQFGEPIRDLNAAAETLWIGTVPPLVVQYIIDEEKRLVFVVLPLKPLPGSGL